MYTSSSLKHPPDTQTGFVNEELYSLSLPIFMQHTNIAGRDAAVLQVFSKILSTGRLTVSVCVCVRARS